MKKKWPFRKIFIQQGIFQIIGIKTLGLEHETCWIYFMYIQCVKYLYKDIKIIFLYWCFRLLYI